QVIQNGLDGKIGDHRAGKLAQHGGELPLVRHSPANPPRRKVPGGIAARPTPCTLSETWRPPGAVSRGWSRRVSSRAGESSRTPNALLLKTFRVRATLLAMSPSSLNQVDL